MFKLSKTNQSKGFTLIELLVVVVIIAILATLAFVAINGTRAKARDAKRVNDLGAISRALELYYADVGSYPSAITPGQPLEHDGVTYMKKIPNNPTPTTDGTCPDNEYSYFSNGLTYAITFCTGNQVSGSGLSAGINRLTNVGFKPGAEYADGSSCGVCKTYQNNVCTNTPSNTDPNNDCTSCQVCNGSGSCTNATDGTDPVNDCTNYTCTDYIYGWGTNPLSCRVYNTATSNNGMCISGTCATLTQSCTGEGAQSGMAVCGSASCKNTCVANSAATSYDTVAEVCYTNNASHGSCASPSKCTASGSCLDFTPCPGYETVTYGGIVYNTVFMDMNKNSVMDSGECWFRENLAYTTGLTNNTHYVCPQGKTGATDCGLAVSGSTSILGYLYNWAALMNVPQTCNSSRTSGTCYTNASANNFQGICPTGWHVAKNSEFNSVLNYANTLNSSYWGVVLKEAGTTYWRVLSSPAANNLTGFTARPAGGLPIDIQSEYSVNFSLMLADTPGDINSIYVLLSANPNYGTYSVVSSASLRLAARCVKNYP